MKLRRWEKKFCMDIRYGCICVLDFMTGHVENSSVTHVDCRHIDKRNGLWLKLKQFLHGNGILNVLCVHSFCVYVWLYVCMFYAVLGDNFLNVCVKIYELLLWLLWLQELLLLLYCSIPFFMFSFCHCLLFTHKGGLVMCVSHMV